MIKIFLILIISIFSINYAIAIEGQCYFEEVYKNGATQNGLLLISDEDIRYEYFDDKLFTIIYSNKLFYLVKNVDHASFEQIDDKRVVIFKYLADIIYQYPNIATRFDVEGNTVDIDKSLNNQFPKRISIKSNKINLSIYLFDCFSKPINKLFFKIDPMFDYPR